MNPIIIQQIEEYIKLSLREHYTNSSINVFDRVMERCKLFYDRPAHSLSEIKNKMNTKLKGDIFEHFVLKYMSHVYGLSEVWLLKDLPDEYLVKLQLKRQDFGIDLVGRDSRNRWYAIQAKYRKANKYKSKNVLGWKQLSTFQAMVTKSGPWMKHIVITNADYIRHIGGAKTSKDKSICLKTLQNRIKNEHWESMAGMKGHRLDEADVDANNDQEDDPVHDDEEEDDSDDEEDVSGIGEKDVNGVEDKGNNEDNEDLPKIILKKPIVFKKRVVKKEIKEVSKVDEEEDMRPGVEELRKRRLMFFEKKSDQI